MARRQRGLRLFPRPTNEVRVRPLCPYRSSDGSCSLMTCSYRCSCQSCVHKCQRNCMCRCQCQHRHHQRRSRVVIVKKALTPIRVKAHHFDIRHLNARHDSVDIYGQNDGCKLPVKVDREGRLEVITKGPMPSVVFSEEAFVGITITDIPAALPFQTTSNKTVYTYSVVNSGPDSISANVEVSPDGSHFVFDSHQQIDPNETAVLVPNYFLKYTRLSLQTTSTSAITTADVYFQAQTCS